MMKNTIKSTAKDNINLDEQPEIMTVDEVATLLRVNKKTIYDSAARGEIPCQKIGRIFRFYRVAVLEWLNGQSCVSHSQRRKT